MKPAQLMGRNYINLEYGKEPIIAEGVSFSGLLDCIHQITIEKDAFTGHEVKLLTGGHDPEFFGEERKKSSTGGPIIIREGVWVGSYAIILGPCEIGRHSVIGAGAVVAHKNIPEFEMWVGNPARCIKRYNRTNKKWERV